jgi:patatin-like phospholipase/acyl hydrolase
MYVCICLSVCQRIFDGEIVVVMIDGQRLRRELGCELWEAFDLICGTSTGGILSIMIGNHQHSSLSSSLSASHRQK